MLRITIDKNPRATTLRVEGRLTGPWVDELERSWCSVTENSPNKPVTVDLCEVTFVDAEGRKVLTWMYEHGTRFRTFGCMAKGVVEEIVQARSRSR